LSHTAPQLCQRSRDDRQPGRIVACGRSGRLQSGRGPSRYKHVSPLALAWMSTIACMLTCRYWCAHRAHSVGSQASVSYESLSGRSCRRRRSVQLEGIDDPRDRTAGTVWHGFLEGRRIWHLRSVISMSELWMRNSHLRTPFERHRVGIPPCGGPGVVVVLRGLGVQSVVVVLGARRAAAACQRPRGLSFFSSCSPGAGR